MLSSPTELEAHPQVSTLAVIECFVSIAIYTALAINYDRLTYFAIAIALAPLVLLRTEESTITGLKLFSRFSKWQEAKSNDRLFRTLSTGVELAIAALGIRIGVAAWFILRHPLNAVRSIPRNWFREALCTDLRILPEILPGETHSIHDLRVPSLGRLFSTLREFPHAMNKAFPSSAAKRLYAYIGMLSMAIPIVLIAYVPATALRVSFKASSFVYAPLAWVAYSTTNAHFPLKLKLERILKGELERSRRALALVVFGLLATSMLYALGLLNLKEALDRLPGQALGTVLLHAAQAKAPQILLCLEATLTYALFFFSDAALARIDTHEAWNEGSVLTLISSALFVRATLAVVTVAWLFVSILQFTLQAHGAVHANVA